VGFYGGRYGQFAADEPQVEETVSRARVLEHYNAIVGRDISAANQFYGVLRCVLDVGGRRQNARACAVQYVQVVVVAGGAQWIGPLQPKHLQPGLGNRVVANAAAKVVDITCGQRRSGGLRDEIALIGAGCT